MPEFKLLDVVEDLVQELAPQAQSKRLSLQSYVGPELPVYFKEQPSGLLPALKSLVQNAIDATISGQVFVAADLAHVTEGAGSSVALQFQIDMTSKGQVSPDIHNLIEELGSKLNYESRPQGGSTWSFIINLEPSRNRTIRPVYGDAGKELKMFLVSNEPAPNRVIQNYLRYAGARCDGCPTAKEALIELSRVASFESPYQLIMIAEPIQDVGLFEFANILRGSAIGKTKLVFVDDVFSVDTREKALLAGFDAYISKPFRQQQLFEATTQLLGSIDSRRKILPEYTPIILVAEDNPVNQQLIRFQLRRLGYDADVVSNGLEAIEALRRQPNYSMVLIDLVMPVLNGWDAARKIRADKDLPNRIPIIAVTSNTSSEAAERCHEVAINEIMYKPIDLEKLKQVLEHYKADQQRSKAS